MLSKISCGLPDRDSRRHPQSAVWKGPDITGEIAVEFAYLLMEKLKILFPRREQFSASGFCLINASRLSCPFA